MSTNYAVIENDAVVNVVVADADIAAQNGWVPLTGEAGIGDIYGGGVFTRPTLDLNALAVEIRAQRDEMLKETDWTQAKDTPDVVSVKWASYRQALRDVPQQAGFPDNIQWPVKPE